jgi:hypothetical protein
LESEAAHLLGQSDARAEEIEATYREAVHCASSQGNKFDELKGTRRIALWLKTRERVAEARAMLADIYGWFTEGFDTLALREAKALLDELNANPQRARLLN